ncbi:MAG: Dyp-type peroxidase [Gordonia sp. (in: high G+C Gram-positive bacteria)]|uniref:Dyp-type peroxidase n=1 Tax=Gordonia sp. (in: high G+C Gram-positive bacteria) TaxID=84139 RepID=UPI0039E48603
MIARGSAGISRRRLLTGTAGLAGLGLGAAAVGTGCSSSGSAPGGRTVEFYGRHQAGITTPEAAHANYIGLDLIDPAETSALAGALRLWTEDAARLTRGEPALGDPEPELAVAPSKTTVTVGLGPRVFDVPKLAARRPSWLRPLPAFTIDRLQERWGQTDVLLLIASDDPVALAHATRILTASVRTRLRIRWVQRGFRTARGTQPDTQTQRNLFGQVDGTEQPDPARNDELIWDDGAEQPWMAGGTSMVIRRIAMHMDKWEELDRGPREQVVGRNLTNGAPLTGTEEHDTPDFTAMRGGIPVIPPSSHVARAHRRSDHEQFLRRSYNYDEPPEPRPSLPESGSSFPEPVEGTPDTSNSGLIFTAFQRDPVRQFVPVQQRLSEHDDLNEWTTPIGSAVYAILPGASPQAPLGASLLGS